MEEKKYYVPELEEFHVGFECEVTGNDHPMRKWSRFTCGLRLEYVDKMTKAGMLRVRVLCREDIEELGWECSEYLNGATWYKLGSHELRIKDGLVSIYVNASDCGPGVSFYPCKNKSKLGVLMKDLGIV